MFEKNLNDLVRGLRNNKSREPQFIAECLDEIKNELRQENMALKAIAVLKLSYIQMLGYDISWAAFNIIEVMSSPKFTHKRIAYMAASQSFHSELDVLMLATNLIKKDMNSQNQYDAGSAMVGLSCFVSPDLARDLANDIMSMMVSSKPYIRKRAVLLMYKIFLNFPESLRPAFPRLKERLEDPDTGVQCAAVNVICELARKNPKNYLALAPLFFKLMTTSSNNWMLIKIIKLFGALCPLEPRLGKKLLEPLTSLIHSTSAMSLLYECINTVIAGLPDHPQSIQLCASKLRLLIEDPDQNLKYLGLLLLNKILKCQPKLVLGQKDLILRCLDDKDESIRFRALDLIAGMITKKSLVDIVKKLMQHIEKTEGTTYRDELVSKIIQVCSQSNYQFITNFEWYIDVLLQLSNVEGTKHGKLIANQMLDIAIRVKAIRKYAVPVFASLLGKTSLLTGNRDKNTSCEVLFAAAWVAGEFAEHISDIHGVIDCLVHPRVTSLPAHIQCVYVQAIAKMFSRVLTKSETEGEDEEEVTNLSEKLITSLTVFTQSSDLEVQDRSCCVLQLIKLVMKMKKEGVRCAQDVSALFAEELLPVAPTAQKKVPVPEGLDLDKWINEPPSESEESDEEDEKPFFTDEKNNSSSYQQSSEKHVELDADELEKQREIRRMFQESNPHYLKMDTPKKKDNIDVDDIPVKELDTSISLKLDYESTTTKKKGKKKGKKGKKGRKESESEDEPGPAYEVAPVVDLGGDVTVTEQNDNGDPHSLLNVDLDTPLGDHEMIPVQQHRVVQEKTKSEKPKKKKSKKGKEEKETTKKKRSKSRGESVENVEKPTTTTKKEKTHKKTKKRNKEKDQTEAEKKATLLAQASEYTKEVKKDDDMDFWLSPAKSPEETPEEESAAADIKEVPAKEPIKTENEKKTKKKSKEKGTKEKKKKTKKQPEEVQPVEDTPPVDAMMLDIDDVQKADPWSHYDILCEDKNLKMLYEIRPDPMQSKQVVASIIFKNLTSHHIQKLEFNVLDSLSMKLVRQIGASSHDPVLVPFQLLPEMTNEGQFAFTVESCVMSQHLRGTLTYIVKESDGSTSEKLDFKILFPVHAYILPQPISTQEFTSLLAGGDLTQKQSLKIPLSEERELQDIVKNICTKLRLVVVEHIDHGASLYGMTILQHPVCLLVKKMNDPAITVDAKSTDFQLLSSVLKELKEIVESL
ncbi:AP-3 complex subunit delta-1-like isoform X2 [Hydractinia symbiolongicarpus]|uniref:AP-3 complex subunit delta-1-like isoform X2 n=1 Tax=Hydractinia symbiolongicarpus TaxID=13093 RepID=UPI002550809D|nr:AP-3 complex subunit delta-1-like isoform X2 [Hydractinia symbiolongicarpus]